MVAHVSRTRNSCAARAFGGRFCPAGGTPKHAMRVRPTLARKLVCTRHQIRSVTTTAFHMCGRTPKPSHDRRGNPSDSDLHAFARCSLPRNCVDAVTSAQPFSAKNVTRVENNLLQPMAKLGSRFGYRKRSQFWGHVCCNPLRTILHSQYKYNLEPF